MGDAFSETTMVIADDHELLRDGLKAMLKKIKGVKILAESNNGKELLEAVRELQPQFVILDIKMPVMDGVEATREIKLLWPEIKVIALTNYDEENLIGETFEAGADAYLLKNSSKEELIEAIEAVKGGKVFYCYATTAKLLTERLTNQTRSIQEKIDFTPREIQVMKLICRGMTNKQIGKQLDISSRTVETHRQSIQFKIGVHTSVGIAVYASKRGLI